MGFRTLDIETLRTLVVAHDCGGFGEAASRLNRTPSAVSLQMKRLQEAIGTPLFRKDGRGVALTDAGDITLRYARRMLARATRGKNDRSCRTMPTFTARRTQGLEIRA